jgi:hypothetical protein
MANKTGAKPKTENEIRKEYDLKFKAMEKERQDNKSRIKQLEQEKEHLKSENIKISKQMAATMPGQEKRVCVQNLAQRLINSGRSKIDIVKSYEAVHGKDAAQKFLKELDKANYKPVEHPRVKAEREAIEKEIADAIEALKKEK